MPIPVDKEHVLIVDKQGILAPLLSNELKEGSDDVIITVLNDENESVLEAKFSHIVVVYTEEISSLLQQLVAKAEGKRAKLILLISRWQSEKPLLEEIVKTHGNVVFVVYGELIGKGIPLDSARPIGRLLLDLQTTGSVRLFKMGMGKTYPTFVDDLVLSIIQVSFVDHGKTNVFVAYPRNEPTEFAITRMLKKINPLLRIDFKNDESTESEETIVIPKPYEFLLEEEYSVEKKLQDLFLFAQGQKSLPAPKESKRKTRLWQHLFLKLSVTIAAIVLLATIGVVGLPFAGEQFLKAAMVSIENGDFTQAQKSAKIAKNLFLSTREFPMLGSSFVETGIERSSLLLDTALFAKTFRAKDVRSAVRFLQRAAYTAQKIKFTNQRGDWLLSLYTEEPLATLLAKGQTLQELLGASEKKNYLVLFQNNSKPRPGGGLIESLAVVTLDRGKLEDVLFKNIEEADSQLIGHVEPPFSIRRYTSAKHWYLRDSNYALDFAKIASTAALLLRLETSDVVSGVVAIDSSFLTETLSILGIAQKESSTSSLNALVQRLKQKNKVPYGVLLAALNRNLLEKHVLFASVDKAKQRFLTVSGVSSSLWDPRPSFPSRLNDFVGVSDAQVATQSAFFSIERNISHSVRIDKQGSISATLTLSYRNKKDGQEDYRSYTRFILPKEAKLQAISIDGVLQKITEAVTNPLLYEEKKFTQPRGLEVETTEDEGKKVIGFLVVAKEKERVVSVSYVFPQKLPLDTFSYSLFVLKQPGTQADPFTLTLLYPEEVGIIHPVKDLQVEKETLSLKKPLASDQHIRIDFARN